MLRRAPTTITLTAADVEQFEANRQRKLWEKQQAQQQVSSPSATSSQNVKEKKSKNGVNLSANGKSKKDRIMGTGN
ncbi:uncharacterized protein BDR25DRAFT_232635 [Lindgomyces ingoldianus]|uniref:Uncharacterized protein n=1 Tax=Lindgomyces ingoldianus TaxID=673940 RepID=A0ACB6QQ04_9PLEO|nr:uncharacterized protein BDR25DRAFT_232635 [Lindgomyces ingoldianus]KAF2468187.1 hypothetical protein BDR25DRAFT_232635 [Lindgomyces ingoldianus]